MDFFNPTLWLPCGHEHRIYGDDNAQTWAVVDAEDYAYLARWRWSWKVSRGGSKRYLRRNLQVSEPNWRENGRVQKTLFLHTVVILRSGREKPTPEHHIPDHLDGDETNCRRSNLDWATYSMNSLNRFGSALTLAGPR